MILIDTWKEERVRLFLSTTNKWSVSNGEFCLAKTQDPRAFSTCAPCVRASNIERPNHVGISAIAFTCPASKYLNDIVKFSLSPANMERLDNNNALSSTLRLLSAEWEAKAQRVERASGSFGAD